MRTGGLPNALASAKARSSSSSCCAKVKSAPYCGVFGLNSDFGAPAQSVLNTGDAISETRRLNLSSTALASAMSFASHMITFLLCIARSSTQPRPNSRAAISQAWGKSCEISSVITDSLNEEALPIRQVNGSAAMPTPRRKSRRVGIGRGLSTIRRETSTCARVGLQPDEILQLRLPRQREGEDRVAGDDRDLLPAVGGVAHRRGVNRRAELDVPQVLAGAGI